ncbi:MAG TPA: hypothetical protein VGR98_20830 [Streptosporangiaceae bacterium]|nr:hypothetical protein [Streptosporangiaceae bacterium]
MAPTYRTKAGYTVEVVQLSDTSGNHDGEWLRVRYHGFHVADVRSVAELERYFPLGELEADALARWARCRGDQYELEVAQRLRPDSTASRSIAVSSASVRSL